MGCLRQTFYAAVRGSEFPGRLRKALDFFRGSRKALGAKGFSLGSKLFADVVRGRIFPDLYRFPCKSIESFYTIRDELS